MKKERDVEGRTSIQSSSSPAPPRGRPPRRRSRPPRKSSPPRRRSAYPPRSSPKRPPRRGAGRGSKYPSSASMSSYSSPNSFVHPPGRRSVRRSPYARATTARRGVAATRPSGAEAAAARGVGRGRTEGTLSMVEDARAAVNMIRAREVKVRERVLGAVAAKGRGEADEARLVVAAEAVALRMSMVRALSSSRGDVSRMLVTFS